MERLRCTRLLAIVALVACTTDTPTVPPKALAGASPFTYPLSLWDQGIQGETMLYVRVDEDGGVDSVRVARSSGHAAFDSSAARGARNLRFIPAHRGGNKLPMWVRVPVRFSRDSTAADTAGMADSRP